MTPPDGRRRIEEPILSANDRIAAENRARFRELGLYVLNLIGSPGCGKTSILEASIARLGRTEGMRVGVIQGDVQTSLDADRVRAAGARAVQIETGGACHRDARMVARVLDELPLEDLDILFIENVGNLVCPAGFLLGEDEKVAVLSVPEGDEKPVKYPALFVRAGAVIINKIDFIPHTNFSLQRVRADLARLNSRAAVLPISCRTGVGFDDWCAYLRGKMREAAQPPDPPRSRT